MNFSSDDESPIRARQRGPIVNNGSVVGLVGSGAAVGSVASKHGVSGLTKAAALEYAMRGIRECRGAGGWTAR
jgi:NAD(P)-dependent dehydrogenase (short-subunit alcohol dehydrogenase family)